jgi:hypothetical protein
MSDALEPKAEIKNQGRNLKREEVILFIKEFLKIIQNIKINGKPFALQANIKSIQTNQDLTIEEIRSVLKVSDKDKVEFLNQLYIRGGLNIISRLFPEENIVNIPTIAFEQVGNTIKINF